MRMPTNSKLRRTVVANLKAMARMRFFEDEVRKPIGISLAAGVVTGKTFTAVCDDLRKLWKNDASPAMSAAR